MDTPETITITLEGKPMRTAALGEGPDAVFGPEFAGTITLRWPTGLDDVVIDARVIALLEAQGARDLNNQLIRTVAIVRAFVLLDVLATEKPAWADQHKPSTPARRQAFVAILQDAERQFGAEKKSDMPAGDASSKTA